MPENTLSLHKQHRIQDSIAGALIITALVFHLINTFGNVGWEDEGFYPTVTYRLLSGDILLADEWHLSQFSSFFLYLPIKLYISLIGSTDGIILASRIIFLLIHTVTTVCLYVSISRYGIASVAACTLYIMYSPMGISSVSYNSLCLSFIILTSLTLMYASKREKAPVLILSGALFSMAVINNPLLAILYVIYIIVVIAVGIIHKSHRTNPNENSKLYKRLTVSVDKNRFRLVTGKSFIFISMGVAIIAVFAVIYYFGTGGTIGNIFTYAAKLFSDPEHNYFSENGASLFSIKELFSEFFTQYSWQFSAFVVALIAAVCDRKKKLSALWLLCGIALFIAFLIQSQTLWENNPGTLSSLNWTLPVFVFGTVCFTAVRNKQRLLTPTAYFYIPGVLFSLFAYSASNMELAALCFGYAVANIACCFYIVELSRQTVDGLKEQTTLKKTASVACAVLLCCITAIQIWYQGSVLFHAYFVIVDDYVTVEKGPMKGLYVDEEYNKNINIIMDDIDSIRERADEESRILITGNKPWVYLYSDMKVGAPTCWQITTTVEWLDEYYTMRPENIPDYVYVPAFTYPSYSYDMKSAQDSAEQLSRYFGCTAERTRGGYILNPNGALSRSYDISAD